jgi:dCMP deaminase
MVTLIAGGGFDVLHDNHKLFLMKAINQVNPTEVIFRLQSDELLNEDKGSNRPLFSYDWRRHDLIEWFKLTYPRLLVTVDKVNHLNLNDINLYLNNDRYIVLFKDSYNFNTFGVINNALLLSEVKGIHTSDIVEQLKIAESKSGCSKLQVGSVLVSNGNIIARGSNGVVKRTEFKCDDVIGCQYHHAEEIALQLAEPGDDLFISYSPCIHCAKLIVSKGIRRVVYFNEHSKLEGLQYLIDNNIQVRKAGLCQNNNI